MSDYQLLNLLFSSNAGANQTINICNIKNLNDIDIYDNVWHSNHMKYGRIRYINSETQTIYLSPAENNSSITLKFVNYNIINLTTKFIFSVDCYNIQNIKDIELINDQNIISLKSQVNTKLCNLLSCNLNTKNKYTFLRISFNKKDDNMKNGLYLYNKMCKIPIKEDYNRILSVTHKEIYKNIILRGIQKKHNYDFLICIAIWNRHEILKKIINYMNNFTLPFNIGFILIYSKDSDKILFNNYDNIHFFFSPNQPLGSKWLSAIQYSMLFNPKMVMILGSDDFVSQDYLIESYNKITSNNFDICMSNNWFTYNDNDNTMYLQKYINGRFLGAGRVLSRKFLNKTNGKIYDHLIKKSLDGYLLETINNDFPEYLSRIYVFKTPHILLYKGNWECLSNVKNIINSPNLETQLLYKNEVITKNIYKKFDIKIKKNKKTNELQNKKEIYKFEYFS